MIRGLKATLSIALAPLALFLPIVPAEDPVRDSQWHLGYLHVAEAHQYSQGRGVTVAVVDTGIDGAHPDLKGNLLDGTDLTFEGPGDGLKDTDGHGTAIAGLIAASGRALGIAPEAKIQSVRAGPVFFPLTAVPQGIEWGVNHGAKVICVAAGGDDGPALQDAITRALDADVVVVAAAGNAPRDTAVRYPAAYPGVVAAGGIDRGGLHTQVSVTGHEITLAAPAVEVVSTDRMGPGRTGYSVSDGTSDAAAIIAGAAALVRSKFPNLPAAEVVHRLTTTADDKGPPGRDDAYGYGVVNLVRALTADVPPLQPTARPASSATAQAQAPPTSRAPAMAILLGGVVLLLLIGAGFLVWRRSLPR